MKTIKNLIYFFRFPALIFTLAIAARQIGAYATFPWLDIPLHLIGGASIAYSFTLIFKYWEDKSWISIKNKLVYILLITSIVALFAVLWELWEFLMTYFLNSVWQGNLEDTMTDFLIGLTGGLIVAIFHKTKSNIN